MIWLFCGLYYVFKGDGMKTNALMLAVLLIVFYLILTKMSETYDELEGSFSLLPLGFQFKATRGLAMVEPTPLILQGN
jgi:hypothetical protein